MGPDWKSKHDLICACATTAAVGYFNHAPNPVWFEYPFWLLAVGSAAYTILRAVALCVARFARSRQQESESRSESKTKKEE